MPTNQQYQRTGSFIPTTQVWDQAQLESVNVNSPEFKKLLVRLYQNINKMALVLNTKSTGAFYEQEFVIGDLFFPNPNNTLSSVLPKAPIERQVARKVVNFGSLPAAGTLSIPHNLDIEDQWTFTRIYGCATNPTAAFPNRRFIPLPYVGIGAVDNLELSVDLTNVTITTGGTNYSGFTITYVVLEFLTL